jgi:predicted deacetylase
MSGAFPEGMPARLVVSLSGLTDARSDALTLARSLADDLDARGVPLTQLIQPASPDGPPAPELVGWVRERGDAIALHGYDHTPDPALRGGVGRKGEFSALPRHEAGLRLTAARRALTGLGLATDLFAAPRWLASPGTVAAARDQGFRMCLDEQGIHLFDDDVHLRARALGFRLDAAVAGDARKRAEAWRSRVLRTEALRVARRAGVVRIGVRAKDLRRPRRVETVLETVDAALAGGAWPTTYAALSATAPSMRTA